MIKFSQPWQFTGRRRPRPGSLGQPGKDGKDGAPGVNAIGAPVALAQAIG